MPDAKSAPGSGTRGMVPLVNGAQGMVWLVEDVGTEPYSMLRRQGKEGDGYRRRYMQDGQRQGQHDQAGEECRRESTTRLRSYKVCASMISDSMRINGVQLKANTRVLLRM